MNGAKIGYRETKKEAPMLRSNQPATHRTEEVAATHQLRCPALLRCATLLGCTSVLRQIRRGKISFLGVVYSSPELVAHEGSLVAFFEPTVHPLPEFYVQVDGQTILLKGVNRTIKYFSLSSLAGRLHHQGAQS
jgi:hypothetical protein